MKFCTNCGKPNDEEQLFCSECGQNFKNAVAQNTANEAIQETDVIQNVHAPSDSTSENNLQDRPVKKPRNKKKTWIISSIIVLAIILIAGHLTMKSVVNPEKTIKAMNADFNAENANAFLKHFHYDDKTKADATGFYDYISDQSWRDIRTELLNKAKMLQENGSSITVTDSSGENKLFNLVKKPVLGGLYNKVEFNIVPTKVTALIDFDDLTVNTEYDATLVQGDTKTVLDPEKAVSIGNYLPGSYKWKTELTNTFGQMNFDGNFTVGENATENKENVPVLIEADFLTVHSNNPDASVWINDVDTQDVVEDAYNLGPIPLDGSITVQARVMHDGKEEKTKKVKVKDTSVQLDFDYIADEERKEELEALADEYKYEIEDIYTSFRVAHAEDENDHEISETLQYIASDKLEKTLSDKFNEFSGLDRENNHTYKVLSYKATNDDTFEFKALEQYTFYSRSYEIQEWKLIRTYKFQIIDDELKIVDIVKDESSRQNKVTRTAEEALEAIEEYEDDYDMDYEDFWSYADYYDYSEHIDGGYKDAA